MPDTPRGSAAAQGLGPCPHFAHEGQCAYDVVKDAASTPDRERSAVPLTTSAAVCTTQQNPGRVRPAYTVTFTVEVSGPDHWQPDQIIAALTKGVRWAEGQQQMSGDHGGFARLRATEVRRG